MNTRLVRAHGLALLLIAALAAPLPAVAAPGPPPARAALAAVSIDNFGRVSDTYYRGAQPEGRDYADLKTLGIKLVIDLQADGSPREQSLVEQAGMAFVRIPMTTHTAPTGAQLEQFLGLVNDAKNQPVYVHCAGGRHRTGVMTAAYRMAVDGWTAERAFKEMKDYNFGADFLHAEFKQFVFGYHPATKTAVAAAQD
jgi:protein tyrosine/serine phosphatase